jgi:predicted enzyme related to lactoylglutathione lyase
MTECVPVGGLFETHLTVSDLGRSVAFYREVVGLPLALEVPERGAAFFWIGGPGGLCSASGRSGPPRWASSCT